MRLTVLATILLFEPVMALSQSLDGNALWEACNGSSESERAFCWGYVFGVNDGGMYTAMDTLQQANGGDLLSAYRNVTSALGYCTPNTATSQQVVDVFSSYLEKNPELRHMPAQALFKAAMKDAFPCQ